MRRSFLLISLISGNWLIGQNLAGFEEMVDTTIGHTVPTVTPEQLIFEYSRNQNIVILDTREQKEYEVSHIQGAICVGYDNFNLDKVKHISANNKIFVYCSIGYRSEKVGEQLIEAGYSRVYNLYGGIFNWINNDYPVESAKGKPTKRIHGYDKDWAKWINSNKGTIVFK